MLVNVRLKLLLGSEGPLAPLALPDTLASTTVETTAALFDIAAELAELAVTDRVAKVEVLIRHSAIAISTPLGPPPNALTTIQNPRTVEYLVALIPLLA